MPTAASANTALTGILLQPHFCGTNSSFTSGSRFRRCASAIAASGLPSITVNFQVKALSGEVSSTRRTTGVARGAAGRCAPRPLHVGREAREFAAGIGKSDELFLEALHPGLGLQEVIVCTLSLEMFVVTPLQTSPPSLIL